MVSSRKTKKELDPEESGIIDHMVDGSGSPENSKEGVRSNASPCATRITGVRVLRQQLPNMMYFAEEMGGEIT